MKNKLLNNILIFIMLCFIAFIIIGVGSMILQEKNTVEIEREKTLEILKFEETSKETQNEETYKVFIKFSNGEEKVVNLKKSITEIIIVEEEKEVKLEIKALEYKTKNGKMPKNSNAIPQVLAKELSFDGRVEEYKVYVTEKELYVR